MIQNRNEPPSGNPFVNPESPSMADALEKLGTLSLKAHQHRDMVSAIRRLCRLIYQSPVDVPANINWVHVRLRRIHPVAMGISEKRLKNIKADVLRALGLAGYSRDRSEWLRSLSPAWSELFEMVPEKHDRWKLTQLAQYCTALDIAPIQVRQDHVVGLLDALEQNTFVDKPAAKVGSAVKAWNRLRASVPGWPQVELTTPRKREPWTIPLDQFPESFFVDVDHWTKRLEAPDPLDPSAPVKPLRPSTIKHRRFQIQEAASALVRSGTPVAEITSLADLVEIDAFKRILRFMMARFENKPTEAIHGLAMGLKAIATHHVQVDESHLNEMRRICQRLNLEVDGLREKNRQRLEQFEDSENLARLLHLPALLVRKASKPDFRPHQAALLIQAALAIEILLYAPMRISNLASLDLEGHIRRLRKNQHTQIVVSIPGHEVKNRKDLNFLLRGDTVELFDFYCEQARPVLLREQSTALFPAQNGGSRRPASLSTLIKQTIFDHTGLVVHAHLFRSLAGKIHSMVQPGDFVTLSHVIGDSLLTAMKSYAQFEQKSSIEHYQNSVDAARRKLRR